MKKKKVVAFMISVTFLSFMAGSSLSYVKFQKENKYIVLIKDANSYLAEKNYEKARELFTESLEIKDDEKVVSKLQEINSIQLSLKDIKVAQELYEKGDFSEALNTVKNILSDSKVIQDETSILKTKIEQAVFFQELASNITNKDNLLKENKSQ